MRLSTLATLLLGAGLALAGCGKKENSTAPKAAAATPGEKPEAPQAATQGSPESVLVAKAIEAAGGLEALKLTHSARIESAGRVQDARYTLVTYREGPKRLRRASSGGELGRSVSESDCWNSLGDMVMECDDTERESLTLMLAATHLTRIYPLTEDRFTLKMLDPGTVAGMAVRRLEVSGAELPTPITLSFDEKGLLVQFEYDTTIEGKKGHLVSAFTDFRDVQGVKFPYHNEIRFDGKVWVDETVTAVSFGKVDEGAFSRPPSFKDGDVKVKKMDEEVVVFAEHKGTLDKLADTVRDLKLWIDKKGYVVIGAMAFVYLEDPPENPNQLVSAEVRFPISLRPPEEEVREGTMGVKVVPGGEVAYTYSRGPYGAALPKIGLVKKWAADNKYQAAGPTAQVGFHDPGRVPEEKLVSELRVPVKPAEAPAPEAPPQP